MPHNLSEETYRRLRPTGPLHIPPHAQPLGTTITLMLEDAAFEPEIVITDTRRDYTWRIVMEPGSSDNTWQAEVTLPRHPTVLTYYFLVDDTVVQERRLVESRDTSMGNRPVYGEWEQVPYKIAVYDPDRMPPEWSKGMVIYQIFPDRFARSQSKDDVRQNLRGVYGHEPKLMNWDDRPENPPLGRDFFGGDLRGIIQKLDYLHEMGTECIYLNPIFTASTNHRYEAVDYYEIDPMLGTEADFEELVEAAHARGIRIVLDAVFNHCSTDSIYFDITGKHGNGAAQSKQSPYYRWFKFDRWPDKFDGWIGLGFMPEFVECPEMIDFFLGEGGVTEHWLRKGIDGWRADVPPDNTDEFWSQFRDRVEAVKPDAWTVAEEWRDATRYLLGDQFNATMNYRLAWSVRGFFAMDYLAASEFDDRLQAWLRDTPEPAIHAQMNLLDSHDTDRLMTACGNNQARFRQAFAFLFAYPGAPSVFYGSEAGLEGAFSEDSRRTVPWDNLDEQQVDFFKRLMTLRKNSPVLRRGSVQTVLIDDRHNLYGLMREYEDERIYAVFNAGNRPVNVTFPLHESDATPGTTWHDLLGNAPAVETGEDGTLRTEIQAYGFAWYAKAYQDG